RRAGGHRGHRTARVVRPRSAVRDWNAETDGALALDRPEIWLDFGSDSGQQASRARLKGQATWVTVGQMHPATAYRRPQRRPSSGVRRARRRALLILVGLTVLVVLLVSAFQPGSSPLIGAGVPASASRLLPAGPPGPLVIAVHGALRIQ